MVKRIFVILIAAFLLVPWVHAHQPRRVDSPMQLGYVYPQLAFRVQGELVWADYNLIRRRHPLLRKLNDAMIKYIIESQFSLVTGIQTSLLGILIEGDVRSIGPTRLVAHPSDSIRSAVTGLETNRQGNPFGHDAIDLKGIGFSPEGELKVLILTSIVALLQNPDAVTPLSPEVMIRMMDKSVSSAKADIAKTQTAKLTASAAQAKYLDFKLGVLANYERAWTLYREAMNLVARRAPEAERATFLHTLLEHVRGMDYMNGVATVDRLLKEAIVQHSAQRLADEWNAKHGTDFQTVDSEFIVALPYDALLPNGEKKRAGVMGRLAGPRGPLDPNRVARWPEAMGVREVLSETDQSNVFGARLDWETPEITDPRVAKWLAWSDQTGHPIDGLALAATRDWEKGNHRAPYDLFQMIVGQLPEVTVDAAIVDQVRPARNEFERAFDLMRSQPNIDQTAFDSIMAIVEPNYIADPVAYETVLLQGISRAPLEVATYIFNFLKQPGDRQIPIKVFQGALLNLFMYDEEVKEVAARCLVVLHFAAVDSFDNYFREIAIQAFRYNLTAGSDVPLSGFTESNPVADTLVEALLAWWRVNNISRTPVAVATLPEGTYLDRLVEISQSNYLLYETFYDTLKGMSGGGFRPEVMNLLAPHLQATHGDSCANGIASKNPE